MGALLVRIAIIALALAALVLIQNLAFGGEYKLLSIEKLDMHYQQFNSGTRDALAPEYNHQWKYRAALKYRLGIFEQLYWDNNVHTEAIQSGPVKTVGWQWEAGWRVNPYISVFHEHHSRHIMDEDPQVIFYDKSKFPVEDSIGIKFIFIEETHGRSTFK